MTHMTLWNRAATGLALPALVVGATLARPVTAGAQAASIDLNGTWLKTVWDLASTGDSITPFGVVANQSVFTFRADSTWSAYPVRDGVKSKDLSGVLADTAGRWTLQGDTLTLLVLQGSSRSPRLIPGGHGRVARKGDQLTWRWISDKGGETAWWVTAVSDRDSTCADTLRLVDASKPLPLPAKPPVTVDPAVLTGTWVLVQKQIEAAGKTDSFALTLGADKSARFHLKYAGPKDPQTGKDKPDILGTSTGTWQLLPGDIVLAMLREENQPSMRYFRAVMVQGQPKITYSSIGCVNNPARVYTRVSP